MKKMGAVLTAGVLILIIFINSDKNLTISVKSEAQAWTISDTVAPQDLKKLEALLTKKPYKGEELKVWVEMTFITPEYVEALAISKAKKVKKEGEKAIATYEKTYDLANNIAFRVKIDSHTINTREYDIQKIAVLRDEQGGEYKPTNWRELPSPMPMMASHHRLGVLFFQKFKKDKSPIIGDKTKYVEVMLRDLGKVKARTFRWEFPLLGKKDK